MTVIGYLRRELTRPETSFVKEFQLLSEKDKSDLKKYAEAEMKLLGIEIDPPKA